MNRRRLYRCRHDSRLAGVAAGLAEYFDLDPSLVRVLWVLSVFLGGLTIPLYIVMALVVPVEPDYVPAGPWQPGSDAWGAPAAATSSSQAGAGEGAADPAMGPDASLAGESGQVGGAAGAAPGTPSAAPGGPGSSPGWTTYGGGPHGGWQPAAPRHGPGRRDPGFGATFFGIVLVLFGALALANEALPDWSNNGHLLWPAFFLGVGVLLVVSSLRRRPRDL